MPIKTEKSKRISHIVTSGTKHSREWANIFTLPINTGKPLYAPIVSKKVERKAVLRNTIKRKIRALLRDLALDRDVVVVITNPELPKYSELIKQVSEIKLS